MKKNENGRSMVEMLGVLAIIGVLSVAGIAAYTMAMNSYRANEVLNTASQAVLLARATNMGQGDANDLDAHDDLGLDAPYGNVTITVQNSNQQVPHVVITNSGVCPQIISKANQGLYTVTAADCS